MSKVLVFSIFLLILSFAKGGELVLSLGEGQLEVKNESLIFRIGSLRYEAPDGLLDEASERYLIAFRDGGAPVIVGSIPGHSVSMRLIPLDGGSTDMLVLFYHAGGNQFQAQGYVFVDRGLYYNDIIPVSGMPVSSNMRSIDVVGGKIIVRNQNRISENEALIVVDEYTIDDGRLVIKSSKETVFRE